jgi:hypothetical protein
MGGLAACARGPQTRGNVKQSSTDLRHLIVGITRLDPSEFVIIGKYFSAGCGSDAVASAEPFSARPAGNRRATVLMKRADFVLGFASRRAADLSKRRVK